MARLTHLLDEAPTPVLAIRPSLDGSSTFRRQAGSAAEVMLLLADRGQHRAVGAADLVLAAVAERAHLTVLHYDRDFEHIAGVTGQSVEAVARLGSL